MNKLKINSVYCLLIVYVEIFPPRKRQHFYHHTKQMAK